MPKILKRDEQVSGGFNNGEILENKPIGFPGEFGGINSISNLFYWANAHSRFGSTIPLHPHKGFEIVTIVLEGSIEHFDTSQNKWLKLNKGDVQIIRSGSGISHSEKFLDNSQVFQIWFDPNISKTNHKHASYNDHRLSELPSVSKGGMNLTIYKGKDSPLKMESYGVGIYLFEFEEGEYKLNSKEDDINSYYLISGEGKVNKKIIEKDDFMISTNEALNFEFSKKSRLFEVIVPKSLPYKTYFESFRS